MKSIAGKEIALSVYLENSSGKDEVSGSNPDSNSISPDFSTYGAGFFYFQYDFLRLDFGETGLTT